MVRLGKLIVSQMVEETPRWNSKRTYHTKFTVLRTFNESTLDRIVNYCISARRLTSFLYKMKQILSFSLRRNLLNNKFKSRHPVVFY
jgi:hypothetical protein